MQLTQPHVEARVREEEGQGVLPATEECLGVLHQRVHEQHRRAAPSSPAAAAAGIVVLLMDVCGCEE